MLTRERPPRLCLALATIIIYAGSFGTDLGVAEESYDEIRVGVRFDAAPFSYRKSLEASERLDDYSGYVVEICKEVLSRVTDREPFLRANLTAVEVTAGTRFEPLQGNGDVDILCGPTSITSERLTKLNVSVPVYLTGVGLARLRDSPQPAPYPASYYCRSIVGFVDNTTSADPGVKELARAGRFDRFSDAVEYFLQQVGVGSDGVMRQADFDQFIGRAFDISPFRNVCRGNYEAAPIRIFPNHITGLNSLCAQEIIYYVADIDIVSDYILRNKEVCDIIVDRNVIFKEHYGIYFRTISGVDNRMDSDSELRALRLFAIFNRELLLLMREGDGVFERAFRQTFGNRSRTDPLERFFRSATFGIR